MLVENPKKFTFSNTLTFFHKKLPQNNDKVHVFAYFVVNKIIHKKRFFVLLFLEIFSTLFIFLPSNQDEKPVYSFTPTLFLNKKHILLIFKQNFRKMSIFVFLYILLRFDDIFVDERDQFNAFCGEQVDFIKNPLPTFCRARRADSNVVFFKNSEQLSKIFKVPLC